MAYSTVDDVVKAWLETRGEYGKIALADPNYEPARFEWYEIVKFLLNQTKEENNG